MRLRASVVATVIFSTILFGQDQPLPKPVTPPVPIPGGAPAPKTDSLAPPPAVVAPAEPPVDAALSPFLDYDVLAVLKIDLKEIDLPVLQQWILQGVEDLRKSNSEIFTTKVDVKHELAQAFAWVEKLRTAGAGRAYAVLDVYDITAERPPFLVIPLQAGADAKAIKDAFGALISGAPADPDTPQARELENAVVVAIPATLERLAKLKPQPKPELWRAFDAAGKGPIRLAFVPSEDSRRTFETLVTELPDELGGGSIEIVTHGLRWACMTVGLPPTPFMRHLAQASDPAAARKLKDIMDKGIAWVADGKEVPPEALAFAGPVAALKPEVHGDQVILEMNESGTRQLASALAVNFVTARAFAQRDQAMSNLRQLSAGIFAYASDHQSELPRDLGDGLNKYLGSNPKALWNDPLRPNQKQPYVYVRLADKETDEKDPVSSILIYENHSTWDDGICAAFGDGHVEWFADEAEFKAKLDATKKANPGAVEMPQ